MSSSSSQSQLSLLGSSAVSPPPTHRADEKRVEVPEPAPAKRQLAPMLQQYVDYKKRYPEHVLLFQVGDFYEVFFEDALIAAELLDIRLTSRDKNSPDPVPMCGVPIHALEEYLPKLLAQGRSCAVVSQVEDARERKGMVRRELTRIVTPGVRFEGDGLQEKRSNFLAAVLVGQRGLGAVSLSDVSTGDLRLIELESEDEVVDYLERVQPVEVVLPVALDGVRQNHREGWLRRVRQAVGQFECHVVVRPFAEISPVEMLKRVQNCVTAEGIDPVLTDEAGGMSSESAAALLAALSYVEEISTESRPRFARLQVEQPIRQLVVDAATRRNLELFETRLDGNRKNSLLARLDATRTSMGARLLREWLTAPSAELDVICARHDCLDELLQGEHVEQIRTVLSSVRDVERLLSRVLSGRANPRDLKGLEESFRELPALGALLGSMQNRLGRELHSRFDDLADVWERLSSTLVEDPPVRVNEGGIIREGFHPQVDEFRRMSQNSKSVLVELETRERSRLGIGSGLRVRYNNVFGYFIEVTKTHLGKIPAEYERKQTLVNAERFVTPELKELEVAVLSARSRQSDLERELFFELREEVVAAAARIQRVSRVLAEVDVLSALADVARRRRFVRPEMNTGTGTTVLSGRHPVVEAVVGEHNFVPNDIALDTDRQRFAVLTGPNMGGKSTYLRQIGIIQLLAQIGSFVPAERAELGVVDRIFTRIGAGDDITRGDSTFMVEMREVTSIVRKATSRSLVLIDEVGRGTATTDGLAIATAIAEWMHECVGCRTVFATHFHELTSLPERLAGAFCISVGVVEREAESDVIFTHRIEPGAADRSYGIEVARLAGLPEALLRRAAEVLRELDEQPSSTSPCRGEARTAGEAPAFSRQTQEVLDRVRNWHPETMTPLQALAELDSVRRLLTGSET
ncbi:MAG: DNA mismatch repair protein MutS [Bdellovibrionales bacterium]|nr:DNA mismatch repair protein MutS [Bdellovibrionales bacterium]